MTLLELLEWTEKRRNEHLHHYHSAWPKMSPREQKYQRDVIRQFEIVIDALRREIEHGNSTSTRDGTEAKA